MREGFPPIPLASDEEPVLYSFYKSKFYTSTTVSSVTVSWEGVLWRGGGGGAKRER